MHWRELVRREVIPLSGKVAMWGVVLLAVGSQALITIATVNICINAAYGLCSMATVRPVRMRLGAAPEIWQVALRRAWTLELASMLAGLGALVLIGLFYESAGRDEVAPLLLLMGWGLPARCGGALVAQRSMRQLPRALRGWMGAALVGLVLLLDASVGNVALALAAREWLTMAIVALSPAYPSGSAVRRNPREDAPAWMEFFAATAAASMRRFFYQAGRSVLHFAFGPFGTVLARTGRGFGLAKRAGTFAHARLVAALVAAAGLTTMVIAAGFVPGAPGLVLSALMLRLGCLGGVVVLWSWLAPQWLLVEADTTDDDDD